MKSAVKGKDKTDMHI